MSLRDLLLILIVLVTLPMAFVRPMVGLWLWIGFSYMNPHRLTWGMANSLPWVQLVAIVTLFSLFINPKQRQAVPWKPVSVLLITFLLWAGLSSLFAVRADAAWMHWTTLLKIHILAFVTMVLVIDRQRLHWILWAIVLSFGFWGAKGGVFTVLTGGSYHVFGPAHSFFTDNNQFALVMCMTLPLMRYLQLVSANKWVRRGLWLLMGLTVISIVGTYSRGGFLALGVMTVMLIVKSRNRFPLIVVGVILAAAALSLMPQKYMARMATINNYEEDASATGRIDSWKFATNVALANPLFGGGFEVWTSDAMWFEYGPPGATHRAIHSIFFAVLGQQGIVGLALYLALILVAWNSLRRIKKQPRAGPDGEWMGDLASMLQVSLVGFLAAGAFLPMAYFALFYQLMALVVVLQVISKHEAVKSRKPGNRTADPAQHVTAQKKEAVLHGQQLPHW